MHCSDSPRCAGSALHATGFILLDLLLSDLISSPAAGLVHQVFLFGMVDMALACNIEN